MSVFINRVLCHIELDQRRRSAFKLSYFSFAKTVGMDYALTKDSNMTHSKPTKRQIAAVMAELGRRGNIGRKKAMTPAELAQRRDAARRSADVRRLPRGSTATLARSARSRKAAPLARTH